jgi:hypothetical protein
MPVTGAGMQRQTPRTARVLPARCRTGQMPVFPPARRPDGAARPTEGAW